MRILVSGSHGLVGSALMPCLTAAGHRVTRLVRSKPRPGEAEIYWDPAGGKIDASSLEGFDAVVHLAGDSIASGRWTAEKKARIRESRVPATRLLAGSLAGLARPPRVLVSASAVGYYGNRGEEVLTERSAPGSDFLAAVCGEWEAATQPAARKDTRVVNLRIGVVLSATGGALAKMLPPFKMGVGGKIGDGKQYLSWIAIDDLAAVILRALETETLTGPVNGVSPNPVTNAQFTRALGRVLKRPTIFPMPVFAARLAFGEMADALLLASQRVEPAKLVAMGYEFRFPELEGAFRYLLGRAPR